MKIRQFLSQNLKYLLIAITVLGMAMIALGLKADLTGIVVGYKRFHKDMLLLAAGIICITWVLFFTLYRLAVVHVFFTRPHRWLEWLSGGIACLALLLSAGTYLNIIRLHPVALCLLYACTSLALAVYFVARHRGQPISAGALLARLRQPGWLRTLLPLLSLGTAVAVFAWLLVSPNPVIFSGVAHNGPALFTIALIFLLFPYFHQLNKTWGILLSLVLILGLFALSLSWVWQLPLYDSNIIGGLLPWSDANGYYWDAQRLLEGQRFSDLSTRRPLFAGFFSFVFGITQHNLRLSLAIVTLLVAFSCYLAARELQQTHGTLAGIISLVVMFLFWRFFSGKILTENLGVALGALSFALLWRGVRKNHWKTALLGVFTLTLGLNARAGAFFVLPMLVIWFGLAFRGGSRFSWRFAGAAVGAILMGFAGNEILVKLVGSLSGQSFSNFSYTLYGVVTGHDLGWTEILNKYPNATPADAYRMALEVFRQNPQGTLIGALRAWQDYFNPRYIGGAFSFLHFPWKDYVTSGWVLHALSAVALIWCIWKVRNPSHSLLVAAFLGILLSVPLVPPVDSDYMRAYAATIPFTAAIIGVGCAILFKPILAWNSQALTEDVVANKSLIPFSLCIILLLFLGPVSVRLLAHPTEVAQLTCPNNLNPITILIMPGSTISIVDDTTTIRSPLQEIHESDFLASMGNSKSLYPDLDEELKKITAGKTIAVALNLQDWVVARDYSYPVWVIIPTKMLQREQGIYNICAQPVENEWVRRYRFYNAISVSP